MRKPVGGVGGIQTSVGVQEASGAGADAGAGAGAGAGADAGAGTGAGAGAAADSAAGAVTLTPTGALSIATPTRTAGPEGAPHARQAARSVTCTFRMAGQFDNALPRGGNFVPDAGPYRPAQAARIFGDTRTGSSVASGSFDFHAAQAAAAGPNASRAT